MTEYKPIPVDVARSIGQQYGKDLIVVLAFDHESMRTHATTWGREPTDKECAVNVRDKCLEAINVDMEGGTTYQDYRNEGERAQVVDELVRVCKAADHAIASLMAVRDRMTDNALQGVRDAISKAIEKA